MGRKKKLDYTVKAVVYLIKERPALETLRDNGDIAAAQILIDLDSIINEAKPTDKQRMAMELVWIEGYKLIEAGEKLNITAQGVYFNLKLLKKKIKTVTERWSEDGLRIR